MKYGFSTGALAKGDFRRALKMLESHALDGVELSALRMAELPDLVSALTTLPLEAYQGRVSIHAPSKFTPEEEPELAARLADVADCVMGIVLHAEAVHDASHWRQLGGKVLIENADGRKHTGRTTAELARVLDGLPDARVCLDLAHVYQVDPTMLELRRMLKAFADRVGQVHLSQLNHACAHQPLMLGIVHELRQVAQLVPDTMVILESCVDEASIASQVRLAKLCFQPLDAAGTATWSYPLPATP
jgi:sugar phosphate isomerase/epimerase